MQLQEEINLEHPENYTLSIRITPAVFAYCIYETETKKVSRYNKIPFTPENDDLNEIQQIVFDSDFLSHPYGKVSVIFVSNDYDLVPQYMIKKDKKDALYNFTHLAPAKQILYCSDIIQQVVTVFNVEEEVYKFLSRNLYNPQFYHHSNIMMQYMEEENKKSENSPKIYLNFHDEFVDIYCYNELSQILHGLTFKGQNERSMVYHILNIWDKCGFDQKTTPLYILGGYNTPNIYVTSKLSEYIKNVKKLPVTKVMDITKKDEPDVSLPLDFSILNSR